MTIDDVRNSRLALLDGIRSAIERLQVEQNVAIEGQESDLDHIAELLQTDQLDAAIEELNDLKTLVAGVFGLQAAQEEVTPLIDNLIAALEKQK